MFNNNFSLFLLERCNPDGGRTGPFRPGAQGRGQVVSGTKPLEQQSLGPGPKKANILGKGLDGKVPGVK
jgi:hypothetical protein